MTPSRPRWGPLGRNLVPRFRLHLRSGLECSRRRSRPEQIAQVACLLDTEGQYNETATLASQYNSNGHDMTPAIDAGFARLAEQRIAAHPLRYYLWLRPRARRGHELFARAWKTCPSISIGGSTSTTTLAETRFSWAYAGLNAVYLLLGLGGLLLRPRMAASMVAYMLLRGVLLLTCGSARGALHPRMFSDVVCSTGGGAAIGWLFSRSAKPWPFCRATALDRSSCCRSSA